MLPDNPSDQGFTPNPVTHVHHYVLKGSGLSCWAECACGEKLAGDNGPIVGSRARVERSIGERNG